MKLSRFERKILFAIVAVAAGPLIGTLLLGRGALIEAYRVGVNPRVEAELARALSLYRDHLAALRDDAERTAEGIARDHRLVEVVRTGDQRGAAPALRSMLRVYPNVARIELRGESGEPIASAERADRLDQETMRLLALTRPIAGGGSVEITVATPAAPFAEYQRAGEVVEVYTRLEESETEVTGLYFGVYLGFFVSVIVVAIGVSIVYARRVTGRVLDLAQATERVGAGDLDVVVPTDAKDEVGELTRSFNDMVADLRESRERITYLQRIGAWQEFARRLAHEIKNPLTPIQLAVQEVHRAYAGDDARYRQKLDEAKAIIEEEVATLRRLVGEFSAFAKLPSAEIADADLGDFLADFERSLGALREEASAAGAAIELVAPTTPLPVRIDAMMLKRALDNLVRNAVEAIKNSGRPGPVRVEARAEDGHAVIEVRDGGPGVPASDRDRVFDPYYTTKSEGTGLGLAIVKKVVLEHAGEIECDAAPEGGACFRLTLRLRTPAPMPRSRE